MSDKYQLSRRKALAALGTIGVAGAGAGMGTSALFTDVENANNNILQAGTMNLAVYKEIVAASDWYTDGAGPDPVGEFEVIDGEALEAGLQFDDVKPGDWIIICCQFYIWDNPGYIQVSTNDLETSGGEGTEPELDEDPDNSADLQDEMVAEVYSSFDPPTEDSDNPEDYVSGLDSTTPDGSTVQETYNTYETGVTLRDGDGNPLPVGGDSDDFSGWDPDDGIVNDDGEVIVPNALCEEWYLLLELPRDTTNLVQGDSFSFDLTVEAEQTRNNDTPFQS